MTNTPEAETVEVIQADRDAAASLWCELAPGFDGNAEDRATASHNVLAQAFARHRRTHTETAIAEVPGQSGASIPAGWTLTERHIDDDCGCPEEFWDTPFGMLHMHLSAGKPSDACLDNGDEGERHTSLTTATVDEARAAFIGWAITTAYTPTAGQSGGDAFGTSSSTPVRNERGERVLSRVIMRNGIEREATPFELAFHALCQARSDFGLVLSQGSLGPMWTEAKEARKRASQIIEELERLVP